MRLIGCDLWIMLRRAWTPNVIATTGHGRFRRLWPYYTARAEHSGWPGILHGGVALTLMDEAFGWSLYFHGSAGLTGRFEARLRQQIPVGANLVIRAWTT